MVAMAAVMRVSSVISKVFLSKGTLKSTLINAFWLLKLYWLNFDIVGSVKHERKNPKSERSQFRFRISDLFIRISYLSLRFFGFGRVLADQFGKVMNGAHELANIAHFVIVPSHCSYELRITHGLHACL